MRLYLRYILAILFIFSFMNVFAQNDSTLNGKRRETIKKLMNKQKMNRSAYSNETIFNDNFVINQPLLEATGPEYFFYGSFTITKYMDVMMAILGENFDYSAIQYMSEKTQEGDFSEEFDPEIFYSYDYPKEVVSNCLILNKNLDYFNKNHIDIWGDYKKGILNNTLDIEDYYEIFDKYSYLIDGGAIKGSCVTMHGLEPGNYIYVAYTSSPADLVILGQRLPGQPSTPVKPSIPAVPSLNKNYIKTKTILNEHASQYLEKIQYFDGLGRPIELVQVGVTPDQKDLVTIQEYDGVGRESKSWMPALSSNKGAFVEHSTVKERSRTLNLNDANPYSEIVYENSPLNRPLEQYGPGALWRNAKKSVKITHQTNNFDYPLYKVDGEKLTKSGNYPKKQLFVTKVIDEDDNESYEFKNKQEQVVITRQVNANVNSDTYYVYDDKGNLCFVLPPLATDALTANTSWTETTPAISEYAYIYRYDDKNRCIAKKLPGADWIYYVHDITGRIIFTQDGESRVRGEWLFAFPDVLGRIVLTGTCKTVNNYPISSGRFDDWIIRAEYIPNGGLYKGYNVNVGKAKASFRKLSIETPVLLTINYYDNYSFIGKHGISSNLDYEPKQGYGKRYNNHKGLLTGTSVASLNSPNEIYHTAIYYDYRGKPIQTKSTNHIGGYDYEYVTYNFIGEPTSRLLEHKGYNNLQTEQYAYGYDHAGRLKETNHKLNSGKEIGLANYEYNELGQIIKNARDNLRILTVSKSYDIRSRLTLLSETHFMESLAYTYGGNIKEMKWGQNSKHRKYNFTYDDKSQLIKADYVGYVGLTNTIDNKDKQSAAYTYDKHGNFKTIERYGKINASSYDLVDKITMEYNGNQLKNATDVGVRVNINESNDFKDYANTTIEYAYNKNGSMTKDLNKGISNIQYNLLNLPKQMDVINPLGQVHKEYVYSANGTKLRVAESTNSTYSTAPVVGSSVNAFATASVKTTDYVNNKIYEGEYLKRILIEGGYIEKGEYYFFLQNHLGSTHLVSNKAGRVIHRNNYYPFGLTFVDDGYNPNAQPYKFTGKELDNGQKIGIYDSHARQQDTHIPRFLSIDPLAEKYYSISPYVYVANNPLKYVDPTGKWIESAWDVANISMGTASLFDNIRQGNIGASIVDGLGIAVDVVALALPIVPAGAGALIKATRATDKAFDVAKNADKINNVVKNTEHLGRAGKKLAKENGVTIKSLGTNDVHKPAHAHVKGGGKEVRIGANGKPLKGEPNLTDKQKSVVSNHLKYIRKEVNKVGKENKKIEDLNKK